MEWSLNIENRFLLKSNSFIIAVTLEWGRVTYLRYTLYTTILALYNVRHLKYGLQHLQFPISTCRVKSQPPERLTLIEKQAASAYPVIHERVLWLYLKFLEHKSQHGTYGIHKKYLGKLHTRKSFFRRRYNEGNIIQYFADGFRYSTSFETMRLICW